MPEKLNYVNLFLVGCKDVMYYINKQTSLCLLKT